jgi:maltooligosyltrehalose trehalohydrolase
MSTERLKIGAALVAAAPFVPMFFQGEEWGASTPFLYFTDHQDPELGRAVSHGRRREFASFGWDPEDVPDPQAEETFERSRLDWSELGKPEHAELLEWHRALIALRREHRLWQGGTHAEIANGVIRVRRDGVSVIASLEGGAVNPPEGSDVLLRSTSVAIVRD